MRMTEMEVTLYRVSTLGACIVLVMYGLIVWDLVAVCIHAVTEVESGMFTTVGHDLWVHVTNILVHGALLWYIGAPPRMVWVVVKNTPIAKRGDS